MGNNNSNVLTKEQAKSIADETGFSKAQVFHFYARFKQIDKNGKNWLSRSDFHNQPELFENMLSDRIVNAMFGSKDRMEFVDFVRLLATFKPTNKKNEEHLKQSKLKLLFSIYDTEMTGVISKKDMLNLIEDMTEDCENATHEVIERIVDCQMEEADTNQDGLINFDEFCRCLENYNLNQRMSLSYL